MVKNDNVINQYIDGRNLLSYLLVRDVITVQENVEFNALGPTVCTEVKLLPIIILFCYLTLSNFPDIPISRCK